eukprot:Protomagalhaensia_wolfi_Nauph_80__86@NODE_104_length_3696_cov_25_511622_g78_i0_p1_GENE_NODE_104_length_3696_cov_25_511622_g78_i0NODE_104_length_3696_cov_25_511622_g78_i0_p1_ORF_typecomplete_len403_score30_82Glyco_trans_1_4/PF13692_6/97Glyco_trans_1_4/PF13692_6/2_9e10Glycos_transf_1/PF00534_20/2_4e02Glycos_transf_1/PF00534_20/2_1e07Glyco_transf_4/PF13439_6/2_1e06Glyco_trans_4_4/PF13579_6/2_7e05_NODE_104_length_3696_cov_25_511622_g78_i03491557
MSVTLTIGLLLGLLYAIYFRVHDALQRIGHGVAAVVVCGDIGRSPRMCNHVNQLSRAIQQNSVGSIKQVIVVGYQETPVPAIWAEDAAILIHPLSPVERPSGCGLVRRVLSTAFKMQKELLTIWFFLAKVSHLKIVIIQNPPAAPHAMLLALLCLIRGARLIIDIHNYGYSIAEVNNYNRFVTWVLKGVESLGFYCAHGRLVVSRAMQSDLKKRYWIDSTVLYDRPTERFANVLPVDKEAILLKYRIGAPSEAQSSNFCATVLTATSYTPDEDLGIMLDGLELYAQKREDSPHLPPLRAVITGKGPLKDHYSNEIKRREFSPHVEVSQVFTTVEDYPRVVACADLGISLHTSSSKLDIPMKVVDMLAVEVPPISYEYPTLKEVLPPGCLSLAFNSSEMLCRR